MTQIIATPQMLKIGEHETPLQEASFTSGVYERTRGPREFYWETAKRLARERGIEFDEVSVAASVDGGERHYLFRKRGEEVNIKKNPKISSIEVKEAIPEYVKFLRIVFL